MKSANDCPWWYNERALLSVFVGALWRTGNEAFEEFSEYKRTAKGYSAGRIDLWFSIRGAEFWAEVKACEIAITHSAKQAGRIQAALNAAKRDVARLAPDGSTGRLAMTFVAPYLTHRQKSKCGSRITWLLEVCKSTRPDAMAWVFPGEKRLPRHKKWVSPGIVVLVRLVKRSRKPS